MKRRILLLAAVAMAVCLPTWLLAGEPGKGAGKKQTMTGTIAAIDLKEQTITVKPPAAAQQVQTQTDVKKKGAQAPYRPMLFRVDANTKITAAGQQQQQQQQAAGSTQQAAGGKGAGTANRNFALLKTGQVVRVVFQREAKQEQAAGSTQQTADKKKDKDNKPATAGAGKEKKREKKGTADKGQAGKRARLALSIEILAAQGSQQQQ